MKVYYVSNAYGSDWILEDSDGNKWQVPAEPGGWEKRRPYEFELPNPSVGWFGDSPPHLLRSLGIGLEQAPE